MGRSGLLIALTTVVLGAAITGSGVAGAQAEARQAVARQAGGAPSGEAISPAARSTPEQLAVGAYLRRRGAVFYGAWWCPACAAQKALFGQEGGAQLPYVECDKSEQGRQRCRAARVRALPTWELNGKRLEGVQSVAELKAWSDYPGAGNSARGN